MILMSMNFNTRKTKGRNKVTLIGTSSPPLMEPERLAAPLMAAATDADADPLADADIDADADADAEADAEADTHAARAAAKLKLGDKTTVPKIPISRHKAMISSNATAKSC